MGCALSCGDCALPSPLFFGGRARHAFGAAPPAPLVAAAPPAVEFEDGAAFDVDCAPWCPSNHDRPEGDSSPVAAAAAALALEEAEEGAG